MMIPIMLSASSEGSMIFKSNVWHKWIPGSSCHGLVKGPHQYKLRFNDTLACMCNGYGIVA